MSWTNDFVDIWVFLTLVSHKSSSGCSLPKEKGDLALAVRHRVVCTCMMIQMWSMVHLCVHHGRDAQPIHSFPGLRSDVLTPSPYAANRSSMLIFQDVHCVQIVENELLCHHLRRQDRVQDLVSRHFLSPKRHLRVVVG